MNKKAFSLVEIIITITIIALLGVISLGGKQQYTENMNNSKVLSDTYSLKNALELYIQENSDLPIPGGNTNYFKKDTTYNHSASGSFGVYGSITADTLAKRYINITPIDPRTNSYYSYGKTITGNQFEIASVQIKDTTPTSKIEGNYTAKNGPYNLIREYNGPNFVFNNSKNNFPYNHDELILTATDTQGNIYREGDTITTTTTQKELFFSDGSVSILEANSTLKLTKLDFPSNDNQSTIVKLSLEVGKIWIKATHLSNDSSLEVHTADSSAAVRGTIFSVSKNTSNTETIIVEGKIDINKTNTTGSNEPIEQIEVKKGEQPKSLKTSNNNREGTFLNIPTTSIDIPDFSQNSIVRNQETLTNNQYDLDTEEEDILDNSAEDTLFCNDTDGIVTTEANNNCIRAFLSADYNIAGDLELKHSESIETTENTELTPIDIYTDYITEGYKNLDNENSNSSGDNLSSYGNVINSGSSLVEKNGHTGIVIHPSGQADFLKYSGLNLGQQGGSFAIELGVQGKLLQSTTTAPKYLFDSTNYKLAMTNSKLKFKIGNNYVESGMENITLDADIFYKVTAIKDNDKLKLKIDNYDNTNIANNESNTSHTGTINSIHIGSDTNKKYQIDSILDYIKIYK